MPIIRIHLSRNNQYYWVLYASNGEAMCWSEQYTTRTGAVNSANRVKQMIPLVTVS